MPMNFLHRSLLMLELVCGRHSDLNPSAFVEAMLQHFWALKGIGNQNIMLSDGLSHIQKVGRGWCLPVFRLSLGGEDAPQILLLLV